MRKKTFNIINILFASLLILFISVGCEDEPEVDVSSELVSVSLIDQSGVIFEDEDIDISVTMVSPAKEAGTISVYLTTQGCDYGTDFTTTPDGSSGVITINVPVGTDSVGFNLTPVYEDGFNDTKKIFFKLKASGGITENLDLDLANVTILNRPEIEVEQTVTAFGEIEEMTASDTQSIAVTGHGLTSGLTIIATNGFQVSENDVNNYTDTLSVTAAVVNAGDKKIFVRFAPDFDDLGDFSGTITFSSDNAKTSSFDVSGKSVKQAPTILVLDELSDFGSSPAGTATSSQYYRISGYRLTEDITITAPASFEVSLDDNEFTQSVSVNHTEINHFNEIVVYARFHPTVASGAMVDGNIVHSSAGAVNDSLYVSGLEGVTIIAYTSFEEPFGATVYQDLGDSLISRKLVNNDGENTVSYESVGGEMGFETYYNSTGGLGATDGDDLGVTVRDRPVPYPDGTQGFVFDDTDGIMKAVFDTVNLSGYTTISLELNYWFRSSSYEPEDYVKVSVISSDGGLEIIALYLDGQMIEDQGIEAAWQSVDMDISSLAGNTIKLVIEAQTDAGSEELYFDNIKILGI